VLFSPFPVFIYPHHRRKRRQIFCAASFVTHTSSEFRHFTIILICISISRSMREAKHLKAMRYAMQENTVLFISPQNNINRMALLGMLDLVSSISSTPDERNSMTASRGLFADAVQFMLIFNHSVR